MAKLLMILIVSLMFAELLGSPVTLKYVNGMAADDECHQPVEVGVCRGSFPRFFYNANTSTCEQFIYGGCGGNENNFKTQLSCQTACVKSK